MKDGVYSAGMNNSLYNWQNNLPHGIMQFLLTTTLFALVITFQSCRNDPNQIKLLTAKGMHDDRATGIIGIYSKNGIVKARLFSDEYIKHPTARPQYSELNNHLKMEFYSDSGTLEHLLTADSCRIYDIEQNAIVWGNVHITTLRGEQLFTEELIWNKAANKFFTEKHVKITTGTEVLEGTGLEANQDFTWYKITHPNGAVQVNKGEVPQ
ncbi:MAG: LPS export ABC transporter periplasmic protein LptC [Chitinophagia bacterium]|nr:LPS export ABC transporter periplasmic protein LptC [Chitinophagia bacterium]